MSTFRKLMSVNAIVAVTLLFGLINNIAITGIFGLNRLVDAYFASFLFIRLFMVLVIDYLGKNFLPIFAARREISLSSASELTSLVVTQVGLLAVFVVTVLVIFSEKLFSLLLPGFDAEGIDTVVATFFIMAPCIVIMSVTAFHEYVWQHGENYNRVVTAKIFVPATLTVFILGFGGTFGTKALPYGFLCGQVIAAAYLLYGIPYQFRFRVGFSDKDFVKILSNSGILMSTGVIARTRSIIVQYFASRLGEGAISAITIAAKICKPIYQSALQGMRMILFSRSAKAVARADTKRFARMHNVAFAGVFFLTMPVAVWYLVEGELIVRAIFQRGAFTDEMVLLVRTALMGLAGTVVISGAVQMASNAFYALDRIRVPATVMPLGTLLFLALVSILTPKFGLLGLVATPAITAFIVFCILMWKLKSIVPSLAVDNIMSSFARYLFAAIVAVLTARFIVESIDLSVLAEFFISMTTVGLVYVLIAWFTGDKLLATLIDKSGVRDWLQKHDDKSS